MMVLLHWLRKLTYSCIFTIDDRKIFAIGFKMVNI